MLPSRAISVPLSSVTGHSVVPGVSEGPREVTDGEAMDGGEELVLVLGLAQMKLHHWARTGEERRRKRARER